MDQNILQRLQALLGPSELPPLPPSPEPRIGAGVTPTSVYAEPNALWPSRSSLLDSQEALLKVEDPEGFRLAVHTPEGGRSVYAELKNKNRPDRGWFKGPGLTEQAVQKAVKGR